LPYLQLIARTDRFGARGSELDCAKVSPAKNKVK
jgi:hypothetical protein